MKFCSQSNVIQIETTIIYHIIAVAFTLRTTKGSSRFSPSRTDLTHPLYVSGLQPHREARIRSVAYILRNKRVHNRCFGSHFAGKQCQNDILFQTMQTTAGDTPKCSCHRRRSSLFSTSTDIVMMRMAATQKTSTGRPVIMLKSLGLKRRVAFVPQGCTTGSRVVLYSGLYVLATTIPYAE